MSLSRSAPRPSSRIFQGRISGNREATFVLRSRRQARVVLSVQPGVSDQRDDFWNKKQDVYPRFKHVTLSIGHLHGRPSNSWSAHPSAARTSSPCLLPSIPILSSEVPSTSPIHSFPLERIIRCLRTHSSCHPLNTPQLLLRTYN